MSVLQNKKQYYPSLLYFSDIQFKVVGVSKAEWSRSMPTIPFVKVYSERKVLLDIDIDIFKEFKGMYFKLSFKENNSGTLVNVYFIFNFTGKQIEPGISTFQFHFLLPPDLPSSFESNIAKIHYYIIVNGKASYKFMKQKKFPFAVRREVNVNNLEEYLVRDMFISWNS